MPGPLLETTRQADLRPLTASGGTPLFEILRQVRAELRRGLSEKHASLFADANSDPVTGDIQWYAPVNGSKTRLTDLKGGEFVGHDADAPAGLVGPGAGPAVGEDLVRRVLLVALAERAQRRRRQRLVPRRDGALGPIRGDDHPAPDDRVLAQLRPRQLAKGTGDASQSLVHIFEDEG